MFHLGHAGRPAERLSSILLDTPVLEVERPGVAVGVAPRRERSFRSIVAVDRAHFRMISDQESGASVRHVFSHGSPSHAPFFCFFTLVTVDLYKIAGKK